MSEALSQARRLVIIDPCPAHKGAADQQLIAAARATLLYLPKYSPDLNPIEQVFSKLKALLRKAAERSVPALCRRIGKLVAKFSARECKNYFTQPVMLLNDWNPL